MKLFVCPRSKKNVVSLSQIFRVNIFARFIVLLSLCKQNEIDTFIRGIISLNVTKEMVRVQHETSKPTARSKKTSQKKTVPFSKKKLAYTTQGGAHY